MTNDATIRYLRDRDTCLGGGSFPCSFALELQRERAFAGAFSASRARFLRALLFAIPLFTCPLSFTRFPTISRSELKERKYVSYITDGNMSIYLKLYVRYENSGLRFIEPFLIIQCVEELKKDAG